MTYLEPDERDFVTECALCARPLREDEADRLTDGATACVGCVNEPEPDYEPSRGLRYVCATLTAPGDVRNVAGGY